MGVLEAGALEVRHRVGFQPDHIILDPEALILEDRANAEDVVIRADHPDGAIIFQNAAAFFQPLMGEQVIGVETVELVPVIVHAGHVRLVRTGQAAAKLQIVGRVGKDEINRPVRQTGQDVDAIALHDHVFL